MREVTRRGDASGWMGGIRGVFADRKPPIDCVQKGEGAALAAALGLPPAPAPAPATWFTETDMPRLRRRVLAFLVSQARERAPTGMFLAAHLTEATVLPSGR